MDKYTIKRSNNFGINQKDPRFHKIQAISSLTRVLLKPLVDQFGAIYVGLLSNWPSIVGLKLAEISVVSSVKFQGANKTKGILFVRCVSSSIPFLQMQYPQILDKINRYFGYGAIEQIRFQGGYVPSKKKKLEKKTIPLSQDSVEKIENLTESIKNKDLQNALNRLGVGIFQEENNNRAS
jgi:hypothetical protein